MADENRVCDRRLSRAAREIVRRHLWMASQDIAGIPQAPKRGAKNNERSSFGDNRNDETVWQLLERYLVESKPSDSSVPATMITGKATCSLLLNPQNDVYRLDEEQSYTTTYDDLRKEAPRGGGISSTLRNGAIPGVVHVASAGRWKHGTSNKDVMLHRCGYCNKTFTSRYYLDRHLDNNHSHRSNESSFVDRVDAQYCPAIAWCNNSFLPMLSCHDMALELEPYYGPGSGGHGRDKNIVHTKLQRQSPPCFDSDLRAAHLNCVRVVHECFGASQSMNTSLTSSSGTGAIDVVVVQSEHERFVTSLIRGLCAEETCQSRLHHKLLSSLTSAASTTTTALLHPLTYFLSSRHRTSYSDEVDHHGLGWMGMVVVVMITLYYTHEWYTSRRGKLRPRGIIAQPARPPWPGKSSRRQLAISKTHGKPITYIDRQSVVKAINSNAGNNKPKWN